MKKLAIVILTLSLTGCAGMHKSLIDGGTSILTETSNPITKERLYQIEASFSAAASAAIVYRRNCAAKTIPQVCREHVERIRPIAGSIRRTLLPQLRAFVRQNDQVNALRVFFEIKTLIDNVRATVGAI